MLCLVCKGKLREGSLKCQDKQTEREIFHSRSSDDKDAADGKRGADDFGFADDAAQDAEETAAEIFSSETLTDVQEETVLG